MIMTNNPIGSRIQDFAILSKIGSGGFATVYKARCLQPGYEDLHIAIKKINKKDINKKNLRKRVDSEIHIHSYLNHPAVVKFYTSFEDENFVYLVLELCSHGSLEEYLKSNGPLSEKDAYHVIKQVIDGVRYLHSKFILHRDLSLKNILFTHNMDIKIADFGMAAELSHPDEKKYTMLGTANFISPEVVRKKSYNSKADCWSVGCILYALLYGTPPFDGKKKKYTEIMNDAVMSPLTFPGYASDEAKELLSDLLNKDPKCRININAPLRYAFFRKYEESCDKKSEFYSQKSADSGMGSLSSSTAVNSRSVHRNLRNIENRVNFFGDDVRDMKLRSSSSDPIDRQVLSVDKFSECYYSNYNSLPRCGSALQNKMRDGRCRIQPPTSRLKERQFRNQIQTLPSRKEIFESVPTGNLFSSSDDKQYMQSAEEQQRWKRVNGHHSEGHSFPQQSCCTDDRSESQLDDVHIRNCSKSPLPYPSHRLQNLTEDHLYSNSYYSGYNTLESAVHSGNMCRYDNNTPCSNSKEFVHKNPSCSHEHYCTSENICSHEMICSCRQYQNSVSKSRNNSLQSHNSCEKERSCHIEVTLERNFAVNKSLKDVVTPLNTIRLSPKRHATKKVIFSILENGQVCLEFLKLKKNEKFVTDVCVILPDGLMICLYKPEKNTIPSNKPPLPGNPHQVQYFSFDNLPETHWKKYQHAKRFVDIIRARTPKVIIYEKDAKCVMMENGPKPDFEVEFYNGYQITQVGNKMTLIDENGGSFPLISENVMSADTKFMFNTFLYLKERCKQEESCREFMCKINNDANGTYFPVSIGRRPNPVLGSQDTNKENASTPVSVHSSILNGAFSAIKSYDGTMNTDNSPFQNSFRKGTQSPVTTGRCVSTLFREIIDTLPNLKGLSKTHQHSATCKDNEI